MTTDQKREFAQLIYLSEPGASQKEIAQRVGVSEVSMSKWVRDGKWEKLRRSKLATRQQELGNAYTQLEELNRKINNREEGERYPNNKEADILVKLASQIRTLETQLSVADVMDVGMHFIDHVRTVAPDKVQEALDLYDSFMKTMLSR